MSDSLLFAVQKYAPHHSITPLENFTTEAFTWLLRNDKGAEKAFLELIKEKSEKRPGSKFNPDFSVLSADENQHWTTQEHNTEGIADIVGRFEGFTIVVEVKVKSGGADDQVQKYVNSLKKKENKQVFGVYLTEDESQYLGKDCLCGLLWEEVYSKLQQADKDKKDWKIQEFLSFLEDNGLFPLKPISLRAWRYSGEVFGMTYTLNKTVSAIRGRLEKEENDPFAQLCQSFSSISVPSQRQQPKWGRVGIHFKRRKEESSVEYQWWNPAVFIGFVIDPTDHKYGDIFEEGAILALIVDIGKSYQKDIYAKKNKGVWSQFTKNLKDGAKTRKWEFHEVDKSDNKKDINMDHPLAVYQPMVKILLEARGTELGKLLGDKVTELLEIFLNSGYQDLIDLFDAIDERKGKTSAE